MQVYGVYDEKCPTASGFGKAGQHIPYIILEHCPCTDLFSFLVSVPRLCSDHAPACVEGYKASLQDRRTDGE